MNFDRLDFHHERDITIEVLQQRLEAYHPDVDKNILKKAYEFAARSHKGQKRSSGEDYIIHPLNVAGFLIKLRLDIDSVVAGLLHDVVEDCDITPEEIEKEFSSSVAQIVVGLTKISKIKFKTKEENQIENFRKMVVAMAKDIRVIIVKLADRMHNMKTLQYVSEQKQVEVAKETLEIYVPLARRLGINSVKSELEDLCLRFIHPNIYYDLAEKIAMKRDERDQYIRDTVKTILEKLQEYNVEAEVTGRPKHFYSIYKKMHARGVTYDEIQDILAFRIIVNNITECYKTLGIVHSSFTPIPGRFKDYIAIPKINNYQSLHTTVVGPKAERIEIQIRTSEMNQVAETGVAAHWKYKESLNSGNPKLDWVDELLEFNKSIQSNSEFIDVVKNDLDIGGIFVFTPVGDVVELRYGSTPLDFAYAVHTEVGNKCVGAKVNGKIVPLKFRLKSGDTLEILTSKTQNPSKDWLKFVKTSRAKTKIKQWLLKNEREEHRSVGEDILEKTLRVIGTSTKALKKSGKLKEVLDKFHAKDEDELYIHVGSGRCLPKEIASFISPSEDKTKEEKDKLNQINSSYFETLTENVKKKAKTDSAVIVDGIDDVLVRLAKCCNPIPGDPIIGYITRGRGITVHTMNCSKRKGTEDFERTIQVEWNAHFTFRHPVSIRIISLDKPGVLANISRAINNLDINIKSAMARSLPDQKGSFIYEIEVKDYSELLKAISAIEAMDEVISVVRV